MDNTNSGNPYKLIRIGEGFYSIEENGVRAFLVDGGDCAMLVDTGFGTGDIKRFLAESFNDIFDGGKRFFVVNTHADRDHIGCNAAFDEVYMHPSDYARYFEAGSYSRNALKPLWNGDIFAVGRKRFEVIHIPGHTPGSIALYNTEENYLISGDSVQTGAIFMFGQGRSLEAYAESMALLEKRSFGVVYASHGEISVEPDIIPQLREGAIKLLAGEVEGTVPPFKLPCKLYKAGRAKFLYEPRGTI